MILLHGWPYDIHSYVDVAPALFVDIAPKRQGRLRYAAPVRGPDALALFRGAHADAFAIGAVGTRGARVAVRAALVAAGFVEGHDAVVVA